MAIRFAKVERIEQAGDQGFYQATLAVREAPHGDFHWGAITILGEDLTTCVERTHRVLEAFNGGSK